jgi:hypothetical protein
MFTKRRKFGLIAYGIFLFFIFARSAQAYVDPGTGSYIFQLLAAGLLSSLFFIKTLTRSIKLFFRKIFAAKKKGEVAAIKNNIDPNE